MGVYGCRILLKHGEAQTFFEKAMRPDITFVVRASGYFRLEDHVEDRKTIIQQNAVAIVFPYIRSQISLLTAQPEVEPVVLPAMNIAQMVEDAVKKGEEKSASCAN